MFTQSPDPGCINTLILHSPTVADKETDYDRDASTSPGNTNIVINDYISSVNNAICPKTCQVLYADNTVYTGSYFSFSSGNSIILKARKDVREGYRMQIKISCFNDIESQQTDSFWFELTADPRLEDCIDQLTAVSPPVDQAYDYDGDSHY